MALYIVPTPLGNLEDITLRALRVLREVQVIACEDTRHTRILLRHHNIHTPTISYHQHSGAIRAEQILSKLKNGEDVALVSDAGTPGISDPGARLVQETIDLGVSVIPLPGASAVITALTGSGLDTSRFLFLGFVPHKKGRETFLKYVLTSSVTIVFYESPHRILKTFAFLSKNDPERRVVMARELTKIHEEFRRGSCSEIHHHLQNIPRILGEFVVIVEAKKDTHTSPT